jgi:hypothetical protein
VSWLATPGRLTERLWLWQLHLSPCPLGVCLGTLQRKSILVTSPGNSSFILSALVQPFSDISSHKNTGITTVSMSLVFASCRSGSSLQMISNEDIDCSASLHANSSSYIINVMLTASTSSDRAFTCSLILHPKRPMLGHFPVILSGRLRRLSEILKMRFARIETHMQTLLNEGFCVPN